MNRAERRRKSREPRHLSLVPELDQDYGVVAGWFQDETDLKAAKQQSHDMLIRLMGDARVGSVQWRWWTGDRAKEVLATLHRDENAPEMSDHLRRIGGTPSGVRRLPDHRHGRGPHSCRGVSLMAAAGWGARHDGGTGTSQQMEDAHKALDAIGIDKGYLALRVLVAVGMLDRLRQQIHDQQEETSMTDETTTNSFEGWALLELMGHRSLAGFVTEQQVAGAGFVRIDVPGADGEPAATQLYAPGAVYCITPCTEATARSAARAGREAPVRRLELLPALARSKHPFRGEGERCEMCGEPRSDWLHPDVDDNQSVLDLDEPDAHDDFFRA